MIQVFLPQVIKNFVRGKSHTAVATKTSQADPQNMPWTQADGGSLFGDTPRVAEVEVPQYRRCTKG